MSRRPEISDDPESIVVENTIFVAVENDVKKDRSLLSWALQNSGGKQVCILIFYQLVQWINILGAKIPISSVHEGIVRDYQQRNRQHAQEIANQYVLICGQLGVRVQKLVREADCIKKEIVEVVRLRKIKYLIMGTELRHRTRMDLRSERARYVREQAPEWCHIQFICGGHIIVIREASAETDTTKEPSSPTSVIDIECDYEERDGSSGMRSSFIDGRLEISTLCRTIQQLITEVAEAVRRMGQEAEGEIGGRWEVLKHWIGRITEAGLAKDREVQVIRSQFAALQDMVNELQMERDNLLSQAEGWSLV